MLARTRRNATVPSMRAMKFGFRNTWWILVPMRYTIDVDRPNRHDAGHRISTTVENPRQLPRDERSGLRVHVSVVLRASAPSSARLAIRYIHNYDSDHPRQPIDNPHCQ